MSENPAEERLYNLSERTFIFERWGIDREQVIEKLIKALRKEGTSEIEIKRVKVVRTHSRKTSPYDGYPSFDGSKFYRLTFKFDKSHEDRPLCVECGTDKIISRGSSWECKACGRRFQKRYRTPNQKVKT